MLHRRSVLLGGITLLAGCGGRPSGAAPSKAPPPVASPSVASPSVTSAPEALEALESSSGTRIGAWALDTATGTVAAHRAGERFPLLSTFKFLAAAAVTQRGGLDRVVHWTRDDLRAHSPVTEHHVDDGLPLADICAAAITQSDNTAGNVLLAELGGPAGLTRFARSVGDQVTRLDRRELALNEWSPGDLRDTTTPEAIGRTLQRLALGDGLTPTGRALLVRWLRATTTGTRRIRAGLPTTWVVGDKTGTGPRYATANDVAVAWPPDGAPIVYAVYTSKPESDASSDESVLAKAGTILTEALGRA